jgi:putative aminopeptidase FrvX
VILQELSEAIGVSSKEEAVRKVILKAIDGHVTDIRIDPMGSITAFKKASGRKAKGETPLRVMLAAHMDEVGFMVTGFDSDGTIRFTPIGGVDERILPGLRVKIGDNGIPGVILWTPIHKNREQNVVKQSNLRIDIGATSKDEASGKVKAGDIVAFDSRFMEIGEKMLRGKSFDDRAGCSVLVDVLQGGPYPVDIVAAFTVQEEIGLRGAIVAAQALKPEVAFVLEGSPAHDVPNPMAEPDEDEESNPACRLTGGPVLTVMDRSMIVHPRLLGYLRQTADKNHIPYQLKTALGGGTDGGSIHTANSGIPTAVISVPCRYIHSPTAYLHRDDYANAVQLVQAALKGLTREAFNGA